MRWGVMEGPFVTLVADGPSAFLLEERWLAQGRRAQVVMFEVPYEWRLVPWESALRPAPRPPQAPRRVPWWDRLGRGGYWVGWLASRVGRNRSPFGRRRV